MTKTFTYGGVNSTASRYYRTELTLTELSVSEENNTSLLQYTLTLFSGNTRLRQWRTGAKIFLGGTEYVHRDGTDYGNQITIDANSSLTLCQGTLTVPHGEDGSCKLSVSFSVYHPETASYTPGNFTYTGGELVLTEIPRATTLAATDCYIGSSSMIALHKKKSGYTHSVAFSFRSLSGYLTGEGGIVQTEERLTATTLPFPIPECFYYEIPASKEGECTLTCRTYDGDTQVGQPQTAVFTVACRYSDCKPSLFATVTDGNPQTLALTGDANVLVRYVSDAVCTLTAESKLGATLTAKTVNGLAIEEQAVLAGAETDTYRFAVTDSRGFTAEEEVKTALVPYIIPTANVTARRENPTDSQVAVTVRGICYRGSFGAADNTLDIICHTPDGTEVPLTPQFQGDTYIAQGAVAGFDYHGSHTLTVEVRDSLTTVTGSTTVQRGIPVFHWGEDYFCTNVPTSICGVQVRKIPGGTVTLTVEDTVLLCGGGVLGTVKNTPEGLTYTGSGQLQISGNTLTFPAAGEVMLLSVGTVTEGE